MVKKATDALLADHKMIRKLLSGLDPDNPRALEVFNTLQRATLMHAWFEDTVFLPAFQKEPLLNKRYLHELYQEHKDIDYFLTLVKTTPSQEAKARDSAMKQFRAILENHLVKEEDALFPIAEKILDSEGMNRIGAEMESRVPEARKLFNS